MRYTWIDCTHKMVDVFSVKKLMASLRMPQTVLREVPLEYCVVENKEMDLLI